MSINPIHINTIGLIFDIVGAWLIAWEVVRKFKGQKIDKDPHIAAADDPPFETEEYKKWESSKYIFMWCGLICLTIGFGLQISSNYLKTCSPIITHPVISETSPTLKPPQNSIAEPIISPTIKAAEPIPKKAINIK